MKYGLVLSGGGTRGFAHLGVVSALYDQGIHPEIISGTSAGAIVGAFIAAGMDPQDVLKIFKKGWLFSYTKIHFPVDGLFKLGGLKEVILQKIETKNIEDLEIPLVICVSNLNTGKIEYIRKGKLAEFVLASASIPLLFSPVEIDGVQYVDGSVLDNIPLSPIRDKCDRTIVSNISPIQPKTRVKNLVQVAARTMYMSVNVNLAQIKSQSDIYIEPNNIADYDIMSLSRAEELYELGYQSTLSELKKNKI